MTAARLRGARAPAALGVALYTAGVVALAVAAAGPSTDSGPPEVYVALVALPPSVLLGVILAWRRPDSPAGPALVWLATAPCLTWVVESWGQTYGTTRPWPGAYLGSVVGPGAWVFNLAGFVALCLVFPDGLLPGRRRRALPWVILAVAVAVNAIVSAQSAVYGDLPAGEAAVTRGFVAWLAVDVAAGVALLAALGAAVGSLVTRYRRGGELSRLQLRWLMLGAGSVPVLLLAGWVAQALGAPVDVAYSGFLLAMLLVLPVTVAIAILRHDLLDVDRLLSEALAWVVTSVVGAAILSGLVVGLTSVEASASRSGPAVGVAAFVAALALLPLHRRVHAAVGRVVDPERTAATAALRDFVRGVRDGERQPEDVQDVLRDVLGDPRLAVLLRLPGADGYVDLAGEPAAPPDAGPDRVIPLAARDSDVGAIVLGGVSSRALRRAREAAVELRLPIEVSRLRVELRRALDDARASRGRLVAAVTEERRRLERDLHDGAQQRIVAVGMRLRSIQGRHPAGDPTHEELDVAVAGLEAVVAELRRLAHGIRPSRLDDGLDVAIRDLVSDSPIPVTVRVDDVDAGEAVATTAYYVVAESLANTLKHAGATRAAVTIRQARERVTVEVTDDGRGGAGQGSAPGGGQGSGLTALRDRVAALGGRLAVESRAGAGTTVRAELQGLSRRSSPTAGHPAGRSAAPDSSPMEPRYGLLAGHAGAPRRAAPRDGEDLRDRP